MFGIMGLLYKLEVSDLSLPYKSTDACCFIRAGE
jgi:hypothetical protein